MPLKEKGDPKAAQYQILCVRPDATESVAVITKLQASRLVRLYAVNASMAETLAPLLFLEAMR